MQTGYTVRRAALACALLVSSTGCRDRSVEAGFWFEPVTFESSRLGGAITPQELQVIESIARSELVGAFKGLAIRSRIGAAPDTTCEWCKSFGIPVSSDLLETPVSHARLLRSAGPVR